MYHCHVYVYLLGRRHRVFEVVKDIAPLEHFTHEYMESSESEKALASKADVIIANLQGVDAKETVRELVLCKAKEAELILLAEKEQVSVLESELEGIDDLWVSPMSDEEIRFRYLKWQRDCKMRKDYWQAVPGSHDQQCSQSHLV